MDFQYIPSAILLQILLFICWSSLLYGLAMFLEKVLPHFVSWSRFWQAWLLVALAPLFPNSFYQVKSIIPGDLITVFEGSQDNLLMHSNSIISQVNGQKELQIFLLLALGGLIVGCFWSVLKFCLALLRVNRLIQKATAITDFKYFNQQQKEVIRINNIAVFTTIEPISPLVFGFFKVSLLLPENVFTMSPEQRLLLIEHELMHIKRQDPKSVIIFRLCSCICWFNPFISYFEKRFLQSMELNCDRKVIVSFPGAKLSYAQALITSIKSSKNSFDSGLTTHFSSPRFNKQDFEKRILSAMSTTPNKEYGNRYRLALVFLSLSSLAFVALAKPLLPLQIAGVIDSNGRIPVLNARISSGYDDINDFRGPKPHKGIDFASPKGTDVIASFSGKVLIADDQTLHRNYGKVVLIEHQGQIQSLYAHLDSLAVESGQYISAGEKLGTVGDTGRTTGPHLHFEILEKGKQTNPNFYLNWESK